MIGFSPGLNLREAGKQDNAGINGFSSQGGRFFQASLSYGSL